MAEDQKYFVKRDRIILEPRLLSQVPTKDIIDYSYLPEEKIIKRGEGSRILRGKR